MEKLVCSVCGREVTFGVLNEEITLGRRRWFYVPTKNTFVCGGNDGGRVREAWGRTIEADECLESLDPDRIDYPIVHMVLPEVSTERERAKRMMVSGGLHAYG